MLIINVPRIGLYLCLVFLSYLSLLPWWVGPVVLLYDTNYTWTFKTKHYRALEAAAEEELRQWFAARRNAETEKPGSGEKWN